MVESLHSSIDWWPFLVATVLVAVMPGPEMVLAVGRSILSGTYCGIMIALGGFLGLSLHVAAAALGLSALMVSSSLAFATVKYTGAFYLIYLGLREIFKYRQETALEVKPKTLWQSAWQGFVASLFNPQTTLFILALLPQFVRVGQGGMGDYAFKFALLGMLFNFITTLPLVALAVMFGATSRRLRHNGILSRRQNLISGGLLVGLGIWFCF